jgi:hypothetical protein
MRSTHLGQCLVSFTVLGVWMHIQAAQQPPSVLTKNTSRCTQENPQVER